MAPAGAVGATVRPADLRFLLPNEVTTALVIGDDELAAALQATGIVVFRAPSDGIANVAFVGRHDVRTAVAGGADTIVVVGGRRRRMLRRAGYRLDEHLVRRGPRGPRLVVPVRHRAALSYAVSRNAGRRGLVDRARRRVVLSASRLGLVPADATVTVASRRPGLPPLVSAAALAVGRPATEWLAELGDGDDLQRIVLLLIDPRLGEPTHVVKTCRIPECEASLDRDAEGLQLVAALGTVARRAPALVARLQVGGAAASVETAATGEALTTFLSSDARDRDKLAAIEAVATWTLELGTASRGTAGSIDTELGRLRDIVVPAWSAAGVTVGLVDGIGAVPAVLAHHDLGSWNIVQRVPGDFVVVDWEAARQPAMPLWDLVYFLVDALVAIDGAVRGDAKVDRTMALLRGEGERSDVLFDWLERGAHALGVSAADVGPVTTLCWLHHGLAPAARQQAMGTRATEGVAGSMAGIAPRWLGDPRLGPAWPAWRARSERRPLSGWRDDRRA